LDGAVDRRARDFEQLGEVEGGVLAAAPQLDQQGFLLAVELWRAGGAHHQHSELEELFSVTRSTICRAVARADAREA